MNNLPRTEAAKRIHVLFKRRPTTAWNPKEIKVMRRLNKDHHFDSLDDLALVERYYEAERRKGDKGIHRRDLYAFLNNYEGEVDRAHAWAEKQKRKSVKPPVDLQLWRVFLSRFYPARALTPYEDCPIVVRDEFNKWSQTQEL